MPHESWPLTACGTQGLNSSRGLNSNRVEYKLLRNKNSCGEEKMIQLACILRGGDDDEDLLQLATEVRKWHQNGFSPGQKS